MATAHVHARNPYIAGKAIGSDRGFFGRNDILRTVQEALSSGHQTAIVLAGQRRIGKTSILLQLQRTLPSERFWPVYFDLMDRAEEPLAHVLSDLASAVAAGSAMTTQNLKSDDEGAFFHEQFLPSLYSVLGEERRPVLLLDEFDVLDSAAQRRLDPRAAAFKLFPYLRRVMEQDDRLGFVFVVGRKPDELSIQFKAAFKSALFKRVSVLAIEDARTLVLTAEREGSLRFEPAALEHILSLTAGHPLFTQLICRILWDRAHNESSEAAPQVSSQDVDSAVEHTLEAGENVFQWIWDGLPPAERIISAAIARATEEHRAVSEEELLVTLQGHGIRILTRELNVAPETLVDWEVLRRVGGGFEYFIELMRIWVQSRKPLPKVKSELDRIVQPADELFRSAETIYRQSDHTGVEELLQQVLRINPNHVNARLLLGVLFLEQDRSADAVTILEQAFQYDEDNARYPLIRALIARGARQEGAGEEDSALKTYDRILALSPQERNARERRSAIFIARGERDLASGNFVEAQAAFASAGAGDRLEQVVVAQRKKRVDELSREISGLAGSGDFESKISVLDELLSLEPDSEQWKAERGRAEQERSVNRAYVEGIKAFSARDLEQSIAAFAEVIHFQPGFKDAASQLARALKKRRVVESRRFRWRKRAVAVAGVLAGSGVLAVVLVVAERNASLQSELAAALANANSRARAVALDPSWETMRVNMVEIPDAPPVTPALELAAGKQALVSTYFIPRSRLLLTGGEDGMVRIWNLDTRKQVFQRDHKSAIRSLAVSKRGDRFLSLAGDNTVRIFAVGFGAEGTAAEIQHVALPGPVLDADLSPDGTTCAALTSGGLLVFSSNTGVTVAKEHHSFITSDAKKLHLRFSPGGDMLAFTDVSVNFLSVPGLMKLDFLQSVYAKDVRWAPDGPVVMLREFSYANRVTIGRIFKTIPDDLIATNHTVHAFAFSPNSSRYAVGTEDSVLVFDRTSCKQILRGAGARVMSVAFDDNNSRVVAGCADGAARVFAVNDDVSKQVKR